MVDPDPEVAPVIFPVIVPIDQLKVLGVLEVRLMLVPTPLQVEAVVELVTKGVGFTVTVMVKKPMQEFDCEVACIRY